MNRIYTKLGVKAKGDTLHEILSNAGLNFQVEKHEMINPLQFRSRLSDKDNFTRAELEEIILASQSKDFQGTFRTDTNDQLGAVKERYTPISHQTSFELLEQLKGEAEGAYYSNVFAMNNGARVGAQIVLPTLGFSVKGVDPHATILSFVTSHDGSGKTAMLYYTLRQVCSNGLCVAENEKALKIKKTKNAPLKMAVWSELLTKTSLAFAGIAEKFDILASKKLTKADLEAFRQNKELFGSPKENSQKDSYKLEEFDHLFSVNDSNQFPQFSGTLFRAFNAVTNQTTHSFNMNNLQPRYDIASQLGGVGYNRNKLAMELLLDMAKTAEDVAETAHVAYSFPVQDNMSDDFADDAPLVQSTVLN